MKCPFSSRSGIGQIVFVFPHAGRHVPPYLYDAHGNPLGVDKAWFERAHESHDRGLGRFCAAMQNDPAFAKDSFLISEVSRLVDEKARHSNWMITRNSSEYPDIAIPGNIECTAEDLDTRTQNVRMPYFHELYRLMKGVRKRHEHPFYLEIHTFNPTWQGQTRDVDIGLLMFEDHQIGLELSEIFEEESAGLHDGQGKPLKFSADEPYNMRNHPELVGKITMPGISAAFDVVATGIEINSRLLGNPRDLEMTLAIICRVLTRLKKSFDDAGFSAELNYNGPPPPSSYKPDSLGPEYFRTELFHTPQHHQA